MDRASLEDQEKGPHNPQSLTGDRRDMATSKSLLSLVTTRQSFCGQPGCPVVSEP